MPRTPALAATSRSRSCLPAFANDPDALARFEREMKTLAGISHPNILAIYDVGRDGANAYAVTELLEGETLADIVARGPLPIRKALEYGTQIARALAAAHDRGIVHRDLKPANVVVTSDGHIKVLDFGLARSIAAPADGATASTTSPGLVMGTIGYMAPEQARGHAVDHRADIFAFGCVMYELISGRRAFDRAKHRRYALGNPQRGSVTALRRHARRTAGTGARDSAMSRKGSGRAIPVGARSCLCARRVVVGGHWTNQRACCRRAEARSGVD